MVHATSKTKQHHIQQWKESGLPLSTYAKKAGISGSNLRNWAEKEQEPDSPPIHFIELAGPSAGHAAGNIREPHAELAFPSGLVLKIYG